MSEEQQVAEVAATDAAVAQSGGEVDFDWRSQLPEEIRDHKSLAHFTDIGAMAKSLVSAQSMIGADKIVIPGKHATDDDWAEFYQKAGRPDSVDGYELENAVPDGVEASEGMLDWFKETALEIGLRPEQAQHLLSKYNNFIGTQGGADEAQVEQLVSSTATELQKEMGAAYKDKMGAAKQVTLQFGATEMVQTDKGPEPQSFVNNLFLEDGRSVGDHPDMIRMMVNIGQYINDKIGEDSLVGVKTTGGLTPDDAKAKLAEIRAPNTPYWDQRHPEHQYYVQEGLKYQEMANVGS